MSFLSIRIFYHCFQSNSMRLGKFKQQKKSFANVYTLGVHRHLQNKDRMTHLFLKPTVQLWQTQKRVIFPLSEYGTSISPVACARNLKVILEIFFIQDYQPITQPCEINLQTMFLTCSFILISLVQTTCFLQTRLFQ